MTYDADICVIGAGSAGLSVAAGTAQLGLRTVLIEGNEMGGDCLNTGCVPSKALLHAARSGSAFADAMAHVRQAIATIAPHDSVERFEGLGVSVIEGYATFINAKTVRVGEQDISAKHIVIATGSSPAIPDIEGLAPDKVLTNQNLFNLSELPEHLVVIGGGPLGLEMAQAFTDLGSKVTVLDQGRILARDDIELGRQLKHDLESQGIRILENVRIKSMAHGQSIDIRVSGVEDELIKASHCLVATGRTPNLKQLHLDAAGVDFTPKGISVDHRLRTTAKNIWAIGDVTGEPQFTHVSGYHASVLVKNLAFKIPAKVDYKALPWVTYTSPELAQIGMTEEQAKAEYGEKNIRVVREDMSNNDRAITDDLCHGKIKAVGLKNGKILGVSILAENAGEMLPLWSLALSKGMKFKDIASLILPYPTRSEICKRVSSAWYTEALFSDKIRKLVNFLVKWF